MPAPRAAALAVPASSPGPAAPRFLAALSRIRLQPVRRGVRGTEDAARPVAVGRAVQQPRRRSSCAAAPTPQTGRATYYFTKAAEAEPSDPDYAFNLGYAYWFGARPAGGDLLAEGGGAPQPGRRRRALRAGRGAAARRARTVEGEREKELARQLSSTYDEWERRPTAAEPVPEALERLREELDRPGSRSSDPTLAPGERKDQEQIWPRFTSTAAAGCSSSSRTARRPTS